MDTAASQTFEDLIDELGGLGRYQVLITFCIIACQFTTGWSMLQMSFAGLIPEYTCLLEGHNSSTSTNTTDDSLNVCSVNGTSCSSYLYHGSEVTVITEWDLICDLKWVKATVTSVQMGGVLVGCVMAGQLSDVFGRRKTLYTFVTFHIVGNLIAAFSVSWVMFAVLRFFIGLGIGAILVVVFPYPMEFLPVKWRPILAIIPSWSIGVAIFSGAALLLENWSYLHIACAVVSVPSLLGCIIVPESIRWLAVQGRLDEAEAVIEKIARFNKKPVPKNAKIVLQNIMDTERAARETARKYSYLDLFRSWKMVMISVILWFFWFTLSTVFYGISFGVSSLSGNLYLNIFLLAIMELPVQTTTFFLNNKAGRRWTTIGFFALSGLSAAGCLIAQFAASGDVRGDAINGLSLTAKMMVGAAWSCTQVLSSELYPTVTRNLGYGFSNMGARVGGMAAPFIIDLDNMVVVSYSVMTGLLMACAVLVVFLPETKGTLLPDSLDQPARAVDVEHKAGHENMETSKKAAVNGKEQGEMKTSQENGFTYTDTQKEQTRL